MIKILRKIVQGFDRAFSRGNGKQFAWLLVIFVLLLAVFWTISAMYPSLSDANNWRVVELMLDPGSFVGSSSKGSVWFQLIVTVVGAIVFTSFTINTIGNVLNRRVESVFRGQVSYRFEGHILILGANSMIFNILDVITKKDANKNRDIVIMTSGDVPLVRDKVWASLPKSIRDNVYVMYGDRSQAVALKSRYADKAAQIYILGEDDEPIHDPLNLECWKHLQVICSGSANVIDCYLVLDRMSSEYLFHSRSDSASTDKLHLVVINAVENAAQRVLVSREYVDGIKYPALDRSGITEDSDINVHLVVVGMTQVAYAMALTAAHICHFPNFAKKRKRTKISFVMKDIQQEMDFFRGHFSQLMDLSYAAKIAWDGAGEKITTEYFPKKEYLCQQPIDDKGFLDVEWEFIDAGIEQEHVREYLRECALKDGKSEYLTLAICEHSAESNVAASIYLPQEIYDCNIPVFVYQHFSGEVFAAAQNNSRFKEVYPFGMQSDCYDPCFEERLERAMCIHYMYDSCYSRGKYTVMADKAERHRLWFQTKYINQQSSYYAANSVEMKFRSIGVADASGFKGSENKHLLLEPEHNRWNIERLLAGVAAYTYEDRMNLRARYSDENQKAEADHNRNKHLRHKDIAPYAELLESSQRYDSVIINNLDDVVQIN